MSDQIPGLTWPFLLTTEFFLQHYHSMLYLLSLQSPMVSRILDCVPGHTNIGHSWNFVHLVTGHTPGWINQNGTVFSGPILAFDTLLFLDWTKSLEVFCCAMATLWQNCPPSEPPPWFDPWLLLNGTLMKLMCFLQPRIPPSQWFMNRNSTHGTSDRFSAVFGLLMVWLQRSSLEQGSMMMNSLKI